jgi:hypothetical protein
MALDRTKAVRRARATPTHKSETNRFARQSNRSPSTAIQNSRTLEKRDLRPEAQFSQEAAEYKCRRVSATPHLVLTRGKYRPSCRDQSGRIRTKACTLYTSLLADEKCERKLLVRQHTMLINAIRGRMAELGVIAPRGSRKIQDLVAVIQESEDQSIPALARAALQPWFTRCKRTSNQAKPTSTFNEA